MSSSSNDLPVASAGNVTADATLSESLADMTVPGVVVMVDAGEAEAMGAFQEDALTEAEAWDANADLDADGAYGG